MAPETTLRQVLERLEKALNTLEQAVDLRLDKEGDFAEAEEEVQRMNADRSRLARNSISRKRAPSGWKLLIARFRVAL